MGGRYGCGPPRPATISSATSTAAAWAKCTWAASTSPERDKFDLDGKFVNATADYMFAFPYTIRTTMSTTDIPARGGKHYRVTYNFGNAVDLEGKDGEPLDKPNKKWKLKKIKVLEGQIVMVFLKKGSSYIARNVSQLF